MLIIFNIEVTVSLCLSVCMINEFRIFWVLPFLCKAVGNYSGKIYSQTLVITRMTTFIKTKFKISEDQTNTEKYKLAANITEYHIISKLFLQRIIIPKYIIIRQLFHVKIFQFKEKKEIGL